MHEEAAFEPTRIDVAILHRLELSKECLEHGKCHPEIASEEVHARFVVRILRVTSLSLVPQGTGYLDACLRDKAKLRRAYGECLGSQKR